MVLPLHSPSLPWCPSLKDNLCALRNAVASARRVTTNGFVLHVRLIARQVQHRVVFGETQDLPRLPRFAARSHSRTLGLGRSRDMGLPRVMSMWHSSPPLARHAIMRYRRIGFTFEHFIVPRCENLMTSRSRPPSMQFAFVTSDIIVFVTFAALEFKSAKSPLLRLVFANCHATPMSLSLICALCTARLLRIRSHLSRHGCHGRSAR